MYKNPIKNQLQESFSLKNSSKSKIKSIFLQLRDTNPSIPYYLLVLDEASLRIISSCLKMMELMETGISAIEKLELKRKRFPSMHAIYFISPCSKSIELILEDFMNSQSPQYSAVHLFFTNRVPKDLMKKIAENQDLLSRVKTFKEIYLDFLCVEDQLFNLDLPDAIPRLFSSQNDLHLDAYIDLVATKLGTAIVSFEKFYEIQIVYNIKSEVSAKIAKNLQSFLVFQTQQLEKLNNIALDSKSGKIIVVLYDRAIDPLTPLIHDFFYQSMIYDLLSIKNDMIDYDEEDKTGKIIYRKAILTDNDVLFKKYRYRHIAEALDGIPAEFQNFINQNTAAKLQQGIINTVDLQKMSEIIKSMPQYTELLGKYSMHMKLIEKAWAIFEEKDLKEMGELEQSLATGVTREGISTKETKLISNLNNFLLSTHLSPEDKLRLVLITLLTIDIPEKEKSKIIDSLPYEDKAVIPKLTWFGYKNENKKDKKNKKLKDEVKKLAKSKLSAATLDLCRYTPKIEPMLDEIFDNIKNGKDPVDIHTVELKSLVINERIGGFGGVGPKSLKNKKLGMKIAGVDDENGIITCPKVLVFGLGGIGYNEIRCAMDMANNQLDDIVVCIGGTSLLTPSEYMQNLKNMNSLF